MPDSVHHLIQKYLDNTCSVEEAEIVLDYFNTSEGMKLLSELIDKDIEEIEKLISKNGAPFCDYNRIYANLQQRIESKFKED